MFNIRGSIEKFRAERFDRSYHAVSVQNAYRVLKITEKDHGALTSKLKETCDGYARSVLGEIRYAPWLYVYSVMSGEFKEGWLPPNYWGKVVVPKVQGAHGRISGFKSLNGLLFRSNHFPDQMYRANDVFIDREGNFLPQDRVQEYMFSNSDRLVFKPDNSMKGRDIEILDKSTFDENQISRFGNGVFQNFIDQDGELDSFFPGAVSTLRLTTMTTGSGSVELRAAYLRLGAGKDKHVSSFTHVRVPVSLSNGTLGEHGYAADWSRLDRHPDSKKAFTGFEYPKFDDAVRVVKQLHSRISFVRCIGWDVCTDRTGQINIMEWNARQNDIKFSEATQGPCFIGLDW